MFLLFNFFHFCPPCLSEISAAALWLPAALTSSCFLPLTWPQCSSWAKTVFIFLSWAAHMDFHELTHGLTNPLISEVPLEVKVIWPLLMWSRTWILHCFVQLSPRLVTPTNLTVFLTNCVSDFYHWLTYFWGTFSCWFHCLDNEDYTQCSGRSAVQRGSHCGSVGNALCSWHSEKRAAKSLCFSACRFSLFDKRCYSFCSGFDPALQLCGSVWSIQLV